MTVISFFFFHGSVFVGVPIYTHAYAYMHAYTHTTYSSLEHGSYKVKY